MEKLLCAFGTLSQSTEEPYNHVGPHIWEWAPHEIVAPRGVGTMLQEHGIPSCARLQHSSDPFSMHIGVQDLGSALTLKLH